MSRLHIVIYDDSDIIREGISAIFSRFHFVQRVTQISDFDELEAILHRTTCHFVLVNPLLLQANIQQFQQIKSRSECVKWIGIVYSHLSGKVLSKLDSTIDIYDSNEAVAAKMMKWLETESDNTATQNKDTLSDREIEVLKLLAEGKSNKEIADALNISIHTVITHRKNITQKTGIKSVSGLTIYAVVQNLISLDGF